jgi:hypothetical protein
MDAVAEGSCGLCHDCPIGMIITKSMYEGTASQPGLKKHQLYMHQGRKDLQNDRRAILSVCDSMISIFDNVSLKDPNQRPM